MNSTSQAFHSILKSLGVSSGDTLLLHSDMRYLVRLASKPEFTRGGDNRKFLLSSFDDALRQSVGPEGTICVLGSYTDYARFGNPFIVEESPPDRSLGAYNAYLFRQPGIYRSLNPIVNFICRGAKAAQICEHTSAYGYGPNTPWDRLTQLEGKIVFWGVVINNMVSTTLIKI